MTKTSELLLKESKNKSDIEKLKQRIDRMDHMTRKSSTPSTSFGSLTNIPTTLFGHKIQDAYTKTQADALFGTPTLVAHDHNGVYLKPGDAIPYTDITGSPTSFYEGSPGFHTHTFAQITATPTTLAGYGIADIAVSGAGVVTIAAGANYTLTVPATGTVAMLGIENVFTDKQFIDGADAADVQFTVQGAASQSANIWENQDSSANVLSGADERGILFSDGGSVDTNFFAGINAGVITAAGGDNVGIGRQALESLTTGTENVGLGAQAGFKITEGLGNFAMGTSALGAVTTGDNNIGLGNQAGELIVTADNNVAIGAVALSDTTASANVGIGRDAGKRNTTGTRNVAIGHGAMNLKQGGNDNVVIGAFAAEGNALSTISSNVFIGASSGKKVITGGNNNTFIGFESGENISTADRSVMVGFQSGNLVTTGDDNIFIGAFSGDKQTTANGLLIVDNQTRADIATELTNSILYGVMAATPATQTLRINAAATITGFGSAVVGLTLKAAASQSANIFEVQDSSANVLAAITTGPIFFINETANTKMTSGITIQMGAADNEGFAVKSSDVTHPFTGLAEADTFHTLEKAQNTAGGIIFAGYRSSAGAAKQAIKFDGMLGENAGTGKTTTAHGVLDFNAYITDGGTGRTSVNANGNIMSVSNAGIVLFIYDADGTLNFITAGNNDVTFFELPNVDGDPNWAWDESQDGFNVSHALSVGGVSPTNATLLSVEAGITFKEVAANPTADPGYAKLFTKSDNHLYFQDGDANDHAVHAPAFSSLWFHGDSTAVTISTEDALTKIDTFVNVGSEDENGHCIGSTGDDDITLADEGGGSYQMGFGASLTATGAAKELVLVPGVELATPLDITDVTDDTVTPIVITSVGHGLLSGDMVEIAGVLVNTAANGSFVIAVLTADTFQIIALDGSATTGNGDYDEGTPTGDVTIWYPGCMPAHGVVSQITLQVFASPGTPIIELLNGDKIGLYVANLDDTQNVNFSVVTLSLNRLDAH